MNSHEFAERIRRTRTAIGMTQSELARLSGVSVPTVQNIEAGKANPAVSTLEPLFGALGLDLAIRVRNADWDLLALCGAPLLSGKRVPARQASPELLVSALRGCCLELSETVEIPDRERKTEALQALLLALRSEFPTFFRAYCRSPSVSAVLPAKLTGRLIRLRRQAAAVLVTYL
ncbi:MAG: helix-turn-helix domain-containing protein [Oligoflexia bacterium]|nr:helix-turn-helix domain-containing protein [Oligoflexia bacterium]